MKLTDEERTAIISYRIDKAFETLNEAKAVAGLGFWTLTANRLYYATYYACVALLIKHGYEANTHAGVSRMVSLNFVKSNILSIDDSRLLKNLFMMRQSGDYDDLFDWEQVDIEPLIPKVESFINKISYLIKNHAL